MPLRSFQTCTLATTITSATSLPWVALNIHEPAAAIRWSYNRTGAGAEVSANVQYTLDNVLEAGASALAINVVTLATAASAATITGPLSGIRLRIGACSGANVFTFRVLQDGK